MPDKHEVTQVRTDFNPQTIVNHEYDCIFHRLVGQHRLAYEAQVFGVEHQFGISHAAAERVVGAVQPNPDQQRDVQTQSSYEYFLRLGREIGREDEIEKVFDKQRTERGVSNVEQNIRFNTKLWGAIYGIDEKSLEPIMRKRVEAINEIFQRVKVAEPNWSKLRNELLEYYTNLRALVHPAV